VTANNLHPTAGCVFVVTHLVPYPPARGVELRIFKLLQWLRSEGYRVVLVMPTAEIEAEALAELRRVAHAVYWTRPSARTRLGQRLPLLRRALWEPLKPLLKPATRSNGDNMTELARDRSEVGDSLFKQALCPDSLVSLVGKQARRYRPQAVIAEYIFLSPCFAGLPAGTTRIVDTIDVFSHKPDQVLAFGIADPQACTEAEERQYLLTADVILAIQSREAQVLKELVPEREVLLVGMDFEIAAGELAPAGVPGSIALVASDNALNVHGLRAFLKECWPQIKAAYPDVSLHIVGKVGTACRIADPAIRYSHWVDDLSQVYRDARVIINPTIAGTGLKIKSAQALGHGKPLVAWTNGVEGLDYTGAPPYIECTSWPEFAAAVVRLLESESEAEALAVRAREYARNSFSSGQVYASLRARLDQAAVRENGAPASGPLNRYEGSPSSS
jgi:glycosyltransferase involved in cell wall biosynthesis